MLKASCIRGGSTVVASGAGIDEVSFDQRIQAEAFVQLAREQEPCVGGHRGAAELDAKLAIEREAKRARCRVTHWVMPSGPARSRRESCISCGCDTIMAWPFHLSK